MFWRRRSRGHLCRWGFPAIAGGSRLARGKFSSASICEIRAPMIFFEGGMPLAFSSKHAFATTFGFRCVLPLPVYPCLGQLPTRRPQIEHEAQRCHWLAPCSMGYVCFVARGVRGCSCLASHGPSPTARGSRASCAKTRSTCTSESSAGGNQCFACLPMSAGVAR